MVKVTPAGPSHSPFVPLRSTCGLQPRPGASQSLARERGAVGKDAGWVLEARPSPQSSSAGRDHPGESGQEARVAGPAHEKGKGAVREGSVCPL